MGASGPGQRDDLSDDILARVQIGHALYVRRDGLVEREHCTDGVAHQLHQDPGDRRDGGCVGEPCAEHGGA